MTRTLLAGGVVFDGTGSIETADVVIEDDRIVSVGSGLDGDVLIDCTGATVFPGFIDCHVHLMYGGELDPMVRANTPFSLNFFLAAEHMRTTLRSGITTVRDAGGADLGIKVARERGLIAGPDLIISITLLSQTGGHGDTWHICGDRIPGTIDPHPGRPYNIVDGPDEMRRRVRELIRAGADVIKVCTSGGNMSPRDDPRHSQFRDDELSVCVAEASAAGLSVMAHATSADGIKAAVRNGIRSVEHGGYLDDESINMMVESGTFLVPTLSATQGVVRAAEAGMNIPDYALAKYRDFLGVKVASFRRALEAGVKIAMGTDSGAIPHGQNLLEIHEMAQAGMPPADALIASTRVAAELLGIADDRGTIEQGKRADIVVVDGEALDVSGMPARVRTVIQAGNRV